MKKISYLIQFFLIIIFFFIFKIIGLKFSRLISKNIFSKIGPTFRSKKVISRNLDIAFPKNDEKKKKLIEKKMWEYYGKIFAEYMFLSNFRYHKLKDNVFLKGQEKLEKIKLEKKPVIFISGHFDNFELLAMQIELSGIELAAIYRPLNNIFLNPIMENLRNKYICKKQIKKGIAGTKELVKNFKSGSSIALMVDQRVSQGILSEFFGKKAYTTTIPAQFAKKYNCKIVPIHIDRDEKDFFTIEVLNPLEFPKNYSIETITQELNKVLENIILKNPAQWIWTHNRWK